MITQLSRIILLITGLVFLSGCATSKQNIKLHESFWQSAGHKITVAKMRAVRPNLHSNGPQGLLDMAISSIATKQFSNYLEKVKLDWYNNLPQKFTAQFKQRDIFTQIYPVEIAHERKNKNGVVIQVDSDKLLLIELDKLGAIRSYYGFIPTSAPKAYCVLKGELINQTDKKILWRHVASIEESVSGNWDQPPSYPNFSAALEQAVFAAQEEIIDSFFSGH